MQNAFDAEEVQIEGMHGRERRWRASARRAAGDRNGTHVEGLTLEIDDAVAGGGGVTITAERGLLRTDGVSELEGIDVRVPPDTVIHAPRASHDPKAETITIAGPVELTSARVQASADGAVVQTRPERVTFVGPVRGRIDLSRPRP